MKTMLAAFAAALILLTGAAFCAELQPFELPSQKENSPERASPPPKSHAPRVDEAVYETFKKKVRTLDAETKKALLRSFMKERDNAADEKDWDKAEHYTRLLEILKREP